MLAAAESARTELGVLVPVVLAELFNPLVGIVVRNSIEDPELDDPELLGRDAGVSVTLTRGKIVILSKRLIPVDTGPFVM